MTDRFPIRVIDDGDIMPGKVRDPHGLKNSFLGREAAGIMAERKFKFFGIFDLRRRKYIIQEHVAPSLDCLLDPIDLNDIHTGT